MNEANTAESAEFLNTGETEEKAAEEKAAEEKAAEEKVAKKVVYKFKGRVKHDGEEYNKDEVVPENFSKEKIEYFLKQGVVREVES